MMMCLGIRWRHYLVNMYVNTARKKCIPKIMPAMREPVTLREKVKLEEMFIAGVLAKVDKPTDLVSQMVVM